jgi:hypothetical protein
LNVKFAWARSSRAASTDASLPPKSNTSHFNVSSGRKVSVFATKKPCGKTVDGIGQRRLPRALPSDTCLGIATLCDIDQLCELVHLVGLD